MVFLSYYSYNFQHIMNTQQTTKFIIRMYLILQKKIVKFTKRQYFQVHTKVTFYYVLGSIQIYPKCSNYIVRFCSLDVTWNGFLLFFFYNIVDFFPFVFKHFLTTFNLKNRKYRIKWNVFTLTGVLSSLSLRSLWRRRDVLWDLSSLWRLCLVGFGLFRFDLSRWRLDDRSKLQIKKK